MSTGQRFRYGLLAGLMMTAPLAAYSYFLYGVFEFPFLAFDLFDWFSRKLPGDIVTIGIDTMVEVIRLFDLGRTDEAAKTMERISAALMFVGLGSLAGGLLFALYQRPRLNVAGLLIGIPAGLIVGLPVLLISLSTNVSAAVSEEASTAAALIGFGVWGLAIAWMYNTLHLAQPAIEPASLSAEEARQSLPEGHVQVISRREFLVQVGAATAVLTLSGTVLSSLFWSEEEIVGGDVDVEAFRPEPTTVDPAPGTRPEYTPLEDHYRIDIASGRGPNYNEEDYRLEISGLVDNPVNLSLDTLRNDYERMDQIITMSCISNPVGGDLISTTLWSGVTMQAILDLVQPREDATHLKITGGDGFIEYVAIDLIREDETVMLTYAWDDVPLPRRHGFPLRIHIPNRYGMKQPKWIEKIEAVDEWEEGHWVSRGWSEEAIVRTTSVVDTVAVDELVEDGEQILVPVGGIAWAGTQGISKVEVRVDDGDWQEALLREPLSDKTWIIWRYDWPFEAGEHTFAVRAYNGNGELQITERNGTRPDGATGIHEKEAELESA